MAITPKYTTPSRNNKYYIAKAAGGYNPSGLSYPHYPFVMPNCFSGDTKVMTPWGSERIDNLVGDIVNVCCIDGQWRPAKFKCFGTQQLFEVKIGDSSYFCTSNHRWPIFNQANYQFIETLDLQCGDLVKNIDGYYEQVRYVRYVNRLEPVYCATEPETSTFVLANGIITGNCVSFAWGRFSEILGEPCKLQQANGGQMFSVNKGVYDTGDVPAIGAMACWAMPGEAGHVAIVEEINEDGSIYTSNSGWGWQSKYPENQWVRKVHGTKSNGWTDWGGYIFQGFIYNPNGQFGANLLKQFVDNAESHIGENGDWTWKTSGLGRGQPWCAAFVMAVGKSTANNIIGNIIPNTFSSSTLAREGAKSGMGTWIPGPHRGNYNAKPQAGDMILFRWEYSSSDPDQYFSDHVGIVKEVIGDTVWTIEGNSGSGSNYDSRVKSNSYHLRNNSINGYYRPNWAKIGGYASSSGGGGGLLYTMENTREDAIVREVAYLSGFKPSISKTNIKLSVINYTSALAGLLNGQLTATTGVSVDLSNSNLDEVPRQIIEHLTSKGITIAGAVGVCANIKHESGFQCGIVEYGYTLATGGGAGLCQWTNYPRTSASGRRTNMINYCGGEPAWRTNLTGQVNFLLHELTTGYTKTYDMLRTAPNTEQGAVDCAVQFLTDFERPANLAYNRQVRSETARELWAQVVPQLTI